MARIAGYLPGVRNYILAHKVISGVVLVAVLGTGYWGYGKLTSTAGETRYVVANVQKGTLIVSVTGTGQVSASNQLDLKSKVSGTIVAVPVESGQNVAAGALIAEIDPTQAQKAVRDAEANLESAQISLQKLQEPADALSLTQAQNAQQNAKDDLTKLYQTSYNDTVSTFLDLPAIMTGLQDIVIGTQASRGAQWNIDYYKNATENYDARAASYRDDAYNKYLKARSAYDTAVADYQSTSQSSDTATIERIVNETHDMAQAVADALGSANSFIQFYEDQLKARNQTPSTVADSALANLNTYIGKVTGHVSSLLSDTNTLQADKQSIVEKTQSLEKLQGGANALDLKSAQLAVTQRRNALQDAKDNLADYFVRAPFSGTVAVLYAKKGDSAGSTALATLITQQKIAQISLNEVDVAKVKVGEKASLTFDAVDGLSIAGAVADIDTIGTVSQGVVSYTVKIGFDTQDSRVKPGMSVSAAIVTDMKQDALLVPNSAVKKQGASSYVEQFYPPLASPRSAAQGAPSARTPLQIQVSTGLSNDTETEILSGIKEGDQVVVRTITGSPAATTQAPSLFGAPGRGAGGGNVRISR